jgi:predicted alpha/beta hydrolase family esterase
MVYWADVLYESPLPPEPVGFESISGAETLPETAGPGAPAVTHSFSEAAMQASLAMKFGVVAGLAELATPEGDAPAAGFERIPLPGFVVKRAMEAWLRDVHHYLYNVQFSPRAGESYFVRDEIRKRLVQALAEGAKNPGPHVLVSHSMGTVIAYDCLKAIPDCRRIDSLMTIGSPLGLDEVQDGLKPAWTRADGYPSERVNVSWTNVYDRLDPVAGFDPNLANDYLQNGQSRVTDIHEPNYGKWRHDIAKYLRGPHLRTALGRMLNL